MFNFGKRKTNIGIVLVLTITVTSLSSCLKIEDKYIWDIVYEYLVKYNPDSPLIPELQKTPGIVERKSKRTVDKAIRDYQRLTADDGSVKIPSPRYSEGTTDSSVCYTPECLALAPPMRLCAPWLDGCSKE